MNFPKITVGLILYKGEKYLSESLPTLLDQKYPGEIEYLIQDHSPNAEAKKYLLSHPLDKGDRGGFNVEDISHIAHQNHSQGHNDLINKMTGEYYFCASFDALYAPDFLEKLITELEENPTYGFASPKILQWNFLPDHVSEKTNTIDSTGLSISSSHQFTDRGQGEEDYKQYDDKQEIFGASGAAMFIRKSAIKKIQYPQTKTGWGYQNPEYYDPLLHYKNDIDLSYRLQWAGEKCLFITDAVMWHDRGLDQKTEKTKEMKEDSAFGHKVMMTKNFSEEYSWNIKIPTKINFFLRELYSLMFTSKANKKFEKHKKEIHEKKESIPKNISSKEMERIILKSEKESIPKIPDNIFFNLKNTSPEISIIVVNYYKAKKVIENIRGIFTQNLIPLDKGGKGDSKIMIEILIIDNSENREEANTLKEMIIKYQEEGIAIDLYISPKNLGYTKANNLAAKNANGDILFFVNPDITWKEENTIQKLTEYLKKNNDVGIVGPKQISEQNGEVEMTARKFPNLFLQITRRSLLRNIPWLKEKIEADEMRDLLTHDLSRGLTNHKVDWLQSSFFAIKKDLFQDLGEFNEKYFLFMADTEICLKCWEKGKKVIYYADTEVYADGIRCSEGGILDFFRKKALRIHLKDAWKYFWKHLFESSPPRRGR